MITFDDYQEALSETVAFLKERTRRTALSTSPGERPDPLVNSSALRRMLETHFGVRFGTARFLREYVEAQLVQSGALVPFDQTTKATVYRIERSALR